MGIAGVNFDKILIEKLKPIEAPLKIDSSMGMTDVSKQESKAKDSAFLKFNFEFKLDYKPKQAELILAGHVLFMDKEKEVDRQLADWKKTKKINPEITRQVLNAALVRCNIKALQMSQEVGLPPHIQFPTIGVKTGKSNYMG